MLLFTILAIFAVIQMIKSAYRVRQIIAIIWVVIEFGIRLIEIIVIRVTIVAIIVIIHAQVSIVSVIIVVIRIVIMITIEAWIISLMMAEIGPRIEGLISPSTSIHRPRLKSTCILYLPIVGKGAGSLLKLETVSSVFTFSLIK